MNKNEVLKNVFGYDEFREGQAQLVDALLAGRDAFGIMPTGAGKSICYQVPALMFPGITLVISPLISLMKDQVAALNQAGVRAAFLNSSLTFRQYLKAIDNARSGMYKIIYVAPERLATDNFMDFALCSEISFVSIDEAHCISHWGQDFRPSYTAIADFIDQLPKRPVIGAFTATATEKVQEDVIAQLRLKDPLLIKTGFDRKNLRFLVKAPKDKYKELRSYLRDHADESGVIYCITRKAVEEVCDKLNQDGFSATRYHAGLPDEERRQNQEDFIYDNKKIIVATNAFGMGIDKSNVRFVVHYNMPKDIESYYQEAGRAGRDGMPAECLLLYSGRDVITNQFLIEQNRDNELLDADEAQALIEKDKARLKQMTFYSTTKDCLRGFILAYFGESHPQYCGNCSNCLTNFEEISILKEARIIIHCILSADQRYGKTTIVKILNGSKDASMQRYAAAQNEYYAALKHCSVQRINIMVQELILQGYLQITSGDYPLLQTTEKAYQLFDEDCQLTMKLPKEAEIKTVRREPVNSKLYDQLKALRMKFAKKNHIPPYLVFSDKTLQEMCQRLPSTKEELLDISGVGMVKYNQYGESFIKVIASFKSHE
ncbi:DNA helicase RecQ [Dielma fastidiosa]|uniref:DNA helicase RecQ n=1 Tax=Dielma fastidiosa TaxID=1034346 RepID=UPI0035613838